MPLRSCAALGDLTAVVGLHVPETDNSLAFLEMGSQSIEEQQDEEEETVKVPKGIKITIKAKKVEVAGKHGTPKRDFKHLPIEMWTAASGHEVRARMYSAKAKQLSMLRSVSSHINSLFDGDTSTFEYRMRLVYAHFPINANITNNDTTIDLRNFLGEKNAHTVNMLPGVKTMTEAGIRAHLSRGQYLPTFVATYTRFSERKKSVFLAAKG